METPIIVKITHQHVSLEIGNPDGGHTTIIYNEGQDKDGQNWSFYKDDRYMPNGLIY